MATSSITKEFRVKNEKAYRKLVKEIDRKETPRKVVESSSLKRGKEKLATFAFR